jgi:PAS domain S-box-containing protein
MRYKGSCVNATFDQVRSALECGQVIPFFQPLIHLRGGSLSGFEVLARWEHPEEGPVLPSNFIQVVEEAGLMGRLTEQVLHRALSTSMASGLPPRLSVNVSPSQLRDSTLPELLRRLGEETGYPLELLTIEITESALVPNMDQAKQVASQLKGLGCRLSLDDFGTGYSSLHHLRGLPFDELKIDRSFVNSMLDNRESRKIVAAVVGLGRSLGLETVGEGVETERQAGMLSWLGCEIGQGWLFGRPAPAKDLRGMMERPTFLEPHMAKIRAIDAGRSSLEAMPEQRLALLEAIYDGTPCFIACLDRQLRYVSLNKRLADLNARSVEEHLGRPMREVVPHVYQRTEKYLLRALKGESISDVEIFREALQHGQRDKTLLASYQPMLDEAGEVIGVLVGMIDITARKKAESALRRRDSRTRFFGTAAM